MRKQFALFCFFREDDVGDDDIIFEDFARLRLKGETDAWPCDYVDAFWINTQTQKRIIATRIHTFDWNVKLFLFYRNKSRDTFTYKLTIFLFRFWRLILESSVTSSIWCNYYSVIP